MGEGIIKTAGSLVVLMLLVLVPAAAWATHIINCIQDEQWILLIVGIFVPPIGWVHGFGLWFGVF